MASTSFHLSAEPQPIDLKTMTTSVDRLFGDMVSDSIHQHVPRVQGEYVLKGQVAAMTGLPMSHQAKSDAAAQLSSQSSKTVSNVYINMI